MVITSFFKYTSDIYQSIPGKTKEDKASYVAQRCINTLKWFAAGSMAYHFTPAPVRKLAILVAPLALYAPFPPLSRIVLGAGTFHELHKARHYSNKIRGVDSWSDRLLCLALAYVSLRWACTYVLELDMEQNQAQPQQNLQNQQENISPAILLTLPFVLRYQPVMSTLGIVASLCAKYFKALVIEKVKWMMESVPDAQKNQAGELKKSVIEYLDDKNVSRAFPLSTLEICLTAGKTWDLLAFSITSRRDALWNGMLQGKILYIALKGV